MRERGVRTAYRIAAWYALSFAAASLLLGGATWAFASRTLGRALDDRLRDELSTLQRADAREGRAALIADIAARDSVAGDGGYLLADRSGRRIVGKVDTPTPPPGLSDVRLGLPDGGSEPARAATILMPNGETLAVVGEAASLARIEATLLAISAAGLGLTIAIGVIGGFSIGHTIHRRLSAVDAAAAAIIDGDLSRRMPIGPRGDEFDRLSATLNRMLDHIGQLMDSLRHVSDDVAHDLRTPLGRLRMTLEAAAVTEGEAAARAGISEALIRVDGLIALFATILRISEIERGAVRGQFGPVRLGALAADIAESFAPAASDGGRAIGAAIDDGVVVRGDEGLLVQAIVNLIENGLKHTRPGARIMVTVASDPAGRPILRVADDGPGIPPEDHATALRRFGRREASRSTPGAGLGLTLVGAIAATHRAELRLSDAAPGLAVTLTFPREVETL